MAEISWAEGPRTALLCIDAWERGVPVGRQSQSFRSVLELVLMIRSALERQECA